MSLNHRWQSDAIDNGQWVHTIGNEASILKTFHQQTKWDELPFSLNLITESNATDDQIPNESLLNQISDTFESEEDEEGIIFIKYSMHIQTKCLNRCISQFITH